MSNEILTWTTDAGFKASVSKSYLGHWNGYVFLKGSLSNSESLLNRLEKHLVCYGGITYVGFREVNGQLMPCVGFDTNHGENIKDPEKFAKRECEHIAWQLKDILG